MFPQIFILLIVLVNLEIIIGENSCQYSFTLPEADVASACQIYIDERINYLNNVLLDLETNDKIHPKPAEDQCDCGLYPIGNITPISTLHGELYFIACKSHQRDKKGNLTKFNALLYHYMQLFNYFEFC